MDELNEKETYFIKLFNSNNSDIGYNLTDGGNQHLFNDEIKKKMSNSAKGRIAWNKNKKASEEHIKNNSISHMGKSVWNKGLIGYGKGRKVSRATKNKIREANIGKIYSSELKEKLSKSHIGQVPWNKNIPMSLNAKLKMIETKKKLRGV
jgi:hypothetical protein